LKRLRLDRQDGVKGDERILVAGIL
ncbi:MAG: hypothetical protein QG552_2196, partial [Thermodesulfobacteriota bacterium]|nr:hypothetical protein [Thermodesulfobacteriota bacterium]